MARNAIAGGHFVKKNQKKKEFRIDLKMARNVIDGSRFVSCISILNGQKCFQK